MLGKLLLCFANSKDCSSSLAYLRENAQLKIFGIFSGASCSSFLQYQYVGQQVLTCPPEPEEYVGYVLAGSLLSSLITAY